MFKANKFLAIIILIFFVFNLISCGAGGGEEVVGDTPISQPSDPTPPPPQTSITDEYGQATFMTSQGQVVTFTIQDKDSEESLPYINLTFIEAQNYKIILIVDDPSGEYVKSIYLDELDPYTQPLSKGPVLQAVQIGVLIVLGITAVSAAIDIGFAYRDLGDAIKEVDAQIKSDFSAIGTSVKGVCYSPEQAADFLWKTHADMVFGGKSIISFLPSPNKKLAVFEIVKDKLLKHSASEIVEWLLSQWYETHVADVAGNKMMAIKIYNNTSAEEVVMYEKSIEVLYKDDAEKACKEELPPLPPSNLLAKVEEYNILKWIELKWDDNSPNEAGFEIERSLNGLDWKPIGTTGPNKNIFSDTYVSGWQTYYYRVRAYGYNEQKSAFSWPTQGTIYSDYNLNPVISSVTANPSTVSPNGTSIVTCNASDLNRDILTYIWTQTGGSVSGTGSTVTWAAPSTPAIYAVTCSVSDGKQTVSKSVNIEVSSISGGSKPDAFTLSGTVACSGSSPVNKLSWTASSGVSSYDVYRCTGSGCTPTFYYDLQILGTTFDNTQVTAGTPYTYFIRATNAYGSTDSNWVTVTTQSCGTSLNDNPSAFTLNIMTGCSGSNPENLLSWTPSSGAAGYYAVYRCTGSNCTPTLYWQNATAVPNTTFRNIAVTAGTTYTYFVRASNSFGYTDSNWVTVITSSCSTGSPPTVTTNVATNITYNSATLNGTVNPNGLSTTVYFQYTANIASGWISTLSANAGIGTTASSWQATVSGLAPNTIYYFRIVATNSTATTYGTILTFTTLSSSIINNPPTISSVVPNPYPPVTVGSSVSITCSVSDPDGDVLIYTWTSTGGSFSGSGSVVTWLAPSTVGTYLVNCSVSDNKGGNDSQGISISVISSTTFTPPATPSNLVATAMSQNNIILAWQDNSDNETGFKIERKTGIAGTFTQIATVAAKSGYGSGMAYDDSGLTAGTTYCYRVRAYNTAGDSPYSYESCATTQTQQSIKPTAATGTATNITSNSATLNGTINPNGVPTYAFFVWDIKTPPLANYTTPTQYYSGTSNITITANITSFTPNTTYYFQIVAVTSTETVFGNVQAFITSGSSTPVERITNGSFSSGSSGWTLVGDFWAGTNLTRYRTSPGYASGGVDSSGLPKINASGYMYQTVTIPSGATSATVSFWLNITSDENTTTTQYDKLFVEVLNASGTVLATLATYSNLDKGPACSPTCIYNQKSFNLTSYKGQTIRIQFRATTDSASDTVFRIDDVSLMSDG